MKKPRNYLIVRGLSRIFRFSSEVHSGDGGSRTLVQTWTQKGFYMLSHPIGFRPRAGWWRPTRGLAPQFRKTVGAAAFLFANLLAPPCRNASQRGNRAMSRLRHLWRGLSDPTMLQIKQRERNCYFRQLQVDVEIFESVNIGALHACLPLLHAVKTSHPRICCGR